MDLSKPQNSNNELTAKVIKMLESFQMMHFDCIVYNDRISACKINGNAKKKNSKHY